MMQIVHNPDPSSWDKYSTRPTLSWDEIEQRVKPIMEAVRDGGDEVIRSFTKQWDQADLKQLLVSEQEFEEAASQIDSELAESIQIAARNIRQFHQMQLETDRVVETMPGVLCWQRAIPIEKVGLYIPGGSAPLFSTVLMLAIPARIAGCKQIQICTPPNPDGSIHPAILYAAQIAGVQQIFKCGGAQAIAGFTFGTESIQRCDKIFGPGNQYVTAAKQLAQKQGIAIDLPAGPSEVLVIVDDHTPPEYAAADLLSQAEHGPDSQVVLVSKNQDAIPPILAAVSNQLTDLPRKEFAEQSLANSLAVSFDSEENLVAFVNQYATEHLIIATQDADDLAEQITNAGSIFIGCLTPESVGDYASGTNHTLPTNGFARSYSGVNQDSFFKKITYQKLTHEGLINIGSHVIRMAEAEELQGHARAVKVRLANNQENGK